MFFRVRLPLRRGRSAGRCLGLALGLLLLRPVWAENSVIAIHGLSFPCDDCSVREADSCEVTGAKSGETNRCDEAISILAAELVAGRYDRSHPSPLQIKQYLLDRRPDESTAAALLTLLSRSPEGYELFKRNAPQLVRLYESALVRFVVDGGGSPGLWRRLWLLPETDGVELGPRLSAAIAARHQAVTLDDLFNRLAESRVRDIEDLQKIERVFQSAGDTASAEVVRGRTHAHPVLSQWGSAMRRSRCKRPAPGAAAVCEFLSGCGHSG